MDAAMPRLVPVEASRTSNVTEERSRDGGVAARFAVFVALVTAAASVGCGSLESNARDDFAKEFACRGIGARKPQGESFPRPRDRGYWVPMKKVLKPKEAETPVVAFTDAAGWSAWLVSHHGSSRGVWLKIAKKASATASVTYAGAVEVALAWGWIDGQKGKLDDEWWLQKFTPRRPKSTWSRINRDKAMALMAAGKMMPAGLSEVERAQKDGRWERAYESQTTASVPENLEVALAKNPRAKRFFATLEAKNRYAILWRVENAKKPETRARRIAQFVEMLANGEKLHP